MLDFMRYTPKEIATMMELAQRRGVPIEQMDWDTFIKYVQRWEHDIIQDALAGRPVCISCHEYTGYAALRFDGDTLYWQQAGNSAAWAAYSGRKELWQAKKFSIEAQKLKDKGPLPEGTYLAPQSRYQERPEDLWVAFLGSFGRGTWKGGYKAWGNHRVWLEPQSGTEVYGRTNFSIHGGTEPGSAGCIDLVENMPEFVFRFLLYGREMYLTVDYGKHRYASSHQPSGPKESHWSGIPSACPSHHK